MLFRLLRGGECCRYEVYANGTLSVSDVNAGDDGVYQCVGLSNLSSCTSSPPQAFAARLHLACQYTSLCLSVSPTVSVTALTALSPLLQLVPLPCYFLTYSYLLTASRTYPFTSTLRKYQNLSTRFIYSIYAIVFWPSYFVIAASDYTACIKAVKPTGVFNPNYFLMNLITTVVCCLRFSCIKDKAPSCVQKSLAFTQYEVGYL